MATENYNLKKPSRDDFYSVDDFNENMDVIDEKLKEIETKAEQAFQSASDGKNKIVTAITGVDPEVTIPENPTFDDLATAISEIESGVDTSDATATSGDILIGKTAYVKEEKVTGTIPNMAGQLYGSDTSSEEYEDLTSPTRRFWVSNILKSHSYRTKGSDSWIPLLRLKGHVRGYVDENTHFDVPVPNLYPHNIKHGVRVGGDNSSVVGTFTSDADAVAGHIIAGKSAYVKGSKVIGTLPYVGIDYGNHIFLNEFTVGNYSGDGNRLYLRPKNYLQNHYYEGGDFWYTVPASTLLANNIRKGVSIFGVAGSATVTDLPQNVSWLSSTVGFSEIGRIQINWNAPTDGKTKGIVIRYGTSTYPTTISEGSLFYDSSDASLGTNYAKTGFTEGATYYFSAWFYNYSGATRQYSATKATCTAQPYRTQGSQIFTSSGTFTVPTRVNKVDVFLVGGGGGGGAQANGGGGTWPGGGGGGYTKTYTGIAVTQGQQIAVIVGAGGSGANANGSNVGGDGGTSSFGSYSATGGKGGAWNVWGGGQSNGGSGGACYNAPVNSLAGTGGSDGGNCSNPYTTGGGAGYGQGSTTRAWGQAGQTLYSGGGGQGGYYANGYGTNYNGGAGGAGGGGAGGNSNQSGASGQTNTGGGGGGASSINGGNYVNGGNGGSGIVLVRWGY